MTDKLQHVMPQPAEGTQLYRSATALTWGVILSGLAGVLAIVLAGSDLAIGAALVAVVGFVLLAVGVNRLARNVDAVMETVLADD